MTSQPTPIRMPLVENSGKVEMEGRAEGLPQGLKQISEVEVSISQVYQEGCYALGIPDIVIESVEPGSFFWEYLELAGRVRG